MCKYNLGDKLWSWYFDELIEVVIIEIDEKFKDSVEPLYWISIKEKGGEDCLFEGELHTTRREAIVYRIKELRKDAFDLNRECDKLCEELTKLRDDLQ